MVLPQVMYTKLHGITSSNVHQVTWYYLEQCVPSYMVLPLAMYTKLHGITSSNVHQVTRYYL